MNDLSHALFKTKPLLAVTQTDCLPLLKHFAPTRSLRKTKQLHALLITSGPVYSHLSPDLASAYVQHGQVHLARKLFNEFPDRSLFLRNTVIRLCVKNRLSYDALKVFVEMLATGWCRPDKYTYPFVVKACGNLSLLHSGVVVHGQTLVAGFSSDLFVQNSLLAMYMNCGETEAARKLFDWMCEHSVVSWNTMISGYHQNGCSEEALTIFDLMVGIGEEPDHASALSVLPAIGHLRDLNVSRRIHKLVEEKGLVKKIAVRNALIDMYSKCGNMDEAQIVFDKMGEKDVVSWTSIIHGYILNGDTRSALMIGKLMQFEGVRPNSVTLTLLLSACASLYSLKDGQCLHGLAIRQKFDCDVVVETALVDMYAKCNRIDISFLVFAGTSKKSTGPWNAILSGCIYNWLAGDAIKIFKLMLLHAVEPNRATFKSLLPAYTVLADLQQAINLHCYLSRSGFLSSIEIATGLIDVYSKCGNLQSAHKIFSEIPSKDKDIILWSVIIAAYGVHGHGETAVSLFKQMVESGVSPNDVTFTSVLHACSHAGLVDEGLGLFKLILQNHQVSPCNDHYTCIVDLLGRAGRLDEAYDLIRTMPFKPGHAVWGALLGACVIHENVDLGELAASWLFELEPENTGNYVLMAKVYAAVGRWRDAENVRHMMNEIGLRKAPAHSLIEVKNM